MDASKIELAWPAVVDAMPGAVMVTDRSGMILWVNDPFCAMTGHARADLVGRTPAVLQGAGTDPAIRAQIREALSVRKSVDVEILNYRADGTPFWNALRIRPWDSEGYEGFVSLQADVTATRTRRQAAAALEVTADCFRERPRVEPPDAVIEQWGQAVAEALVPAQWVLTHWPPQTTAPPRTWTWGSRAPEGSSWQAEVRDGEGGRWSGTLTGVLDSGHAAALAYRLVRAAARWWTQSRRRERDARRQRIREAYTEALRRWLSEGDPSGADRTLVHALRDWAGMPAVAVWRRTARGDALERVAGGSELGPDYVALAELPPDSAPLARALWLAGRQGLPEWIPSLPGLEGWSVGVWPIPQPEEAVPQGVLAIACDGDMALDSEWRAAMNDFAQAAGLAWTEKAQRHRHRLVAAWHRLTVTVHDLVFAEVPWETLWGRLVDAVVRETDCLGVYVAGPSEQGGWRLLAQAARVAGLERALHRMPWQHWHTNDRTMKLAVRQAAETGRPAGPVSPRDDAALAWLRDLDPAWALVGAAMAWPVVRPGAGVDAVLVVLAGDANYFHPEVQAAVGDMVRQLGSVRRQQATQAALTAWAWTDPLTGLANRRRLEDFLADQAPRHEGDRVLVLVWIDLDAFKQVNDRWGHLTGDRLLQRIAGRLQAVVRKTDCVARWGGDEFVLACPDIRGAEGVNAVIQRLCAQWPVPVPAPGEGQLGASIGVAWWPTHGHTLRRVLQRADHAAYRAKAVPRAEPSVWVAVAGRPPVSCAHWRRSPAPAR